MCNVMTCQVMSMAKSAGSGVELRALSCELGLLERADGSARVLQGSTSVLCAIYGPAEVKISKEDCDKAVLDVVVKPSSGLSGPRQRQLEQLISGCCGAVTRTKAHPHTAISITLQVENDGGSLLSVMVQACCLALLDACVPMTSVFAGVTCAYTEDDKCILDPTSEQEQDSKSLLTFVTNETTDEILTSYAEGSFTHSQLQQALELAKSVSKNVTAFYREAIQRKHSKDA